MTSMVRIERRFRGPPESGNGGYVAGVLAETAGGSNIVVTLRRPPPLDHDLEIREEGDGYSLRNGEEVIASAEWAEVQLAPPTAPDASAVQAASARYTGFHHHIFPGCFVCGPERREGDGLRIFAGPMEQAVVAAPWVPSSDLSDSEGLVLPRFIWAALDCPGYFAVQGHAGLAVLGRLAVRLEERPRCRAPLTVVGWHLESDGRKHRAGTALYDGDKLLAVGNAVWISLKSPAA